MEASKAIDRDRLTTIKLFVTIYLLSLFFINAELLEKPNRFQYLAYAIVSEHTIDITGAERQLGAIVNASTFRGRRIIGINPGIAFLVVPAYGISQFLEINERVSSLLGLRTLRAYQGMVFGATVNAPLAGLFTTSLWLILRRLGSTRRLSIFISLSAFFGSMTAYYFSIGESIQTGGDLAMTTAALFMLLKAQQVHRSNVHVTFAGLFMGFAVLIDAPAVLTTTFMFVYIVATNRRNLWLYFVAGLVPGTALLMAYQWLALGNPLMLFHFADPYAPALTFAPVSLVTMAWNNLVGSNMGIVWYLPLLLALIFGGLRICKLHMHLSVLCWVSIIGHWSLGTGYSYWSWNTWGGPPDWTWEANVGAWGPRYVLLVVPFVAILVAQLDYRTLWRQTLVAWIGFLGLIFHLPSLIYAAGGPVFRSLVLVLKHGPGNAVYREAVQVFQFENTTVPSNLVLFSLWVSLLLVLIMWLWASEYFRDWIFKGTVFSAPASVATDRNGLRFLKRRSKSNSAV